MSLPMSWERWRPAVERLAARRLPSGGWHCRVPAVQVAARGLSAQRPKGPEWQRQTSQQGRLRRRAGKAGLRRDGSGVSSRRRPARRVRRILPRFASEWVPVLRSGRWSLAPPSQLAPPAQALTRSCGDFATRKRDYPSTGSNSQKPLSSSSMRISRLPAWLG